MAGRTASKPAFLFAPGAGAPSSHPWMQHWARLLGTLGRVQLLDYPYMREGRKQPDRLPKLVTAHRAALDEVRSSHAGPVFLIGKSMGGRVGCHVSLEESVAGVICLGYPLCGGGDPSKLRDAVLKEMTVPILFVQGTRDSLCPLELLGNVRREMRAPNDLHVIASGDHSLLVTKSHLKTTGQTQDDVDETALQVIRGFIEKNR